MGRLSRRIKRRIHRPSPGLVIGCLALTIAMGGSASALNGINTVENDDLKNNSVNSREIAPDAVRTSDIHDGAVHDDQLAAIVEQDGPNIQINDAAQDGEFSVGSGGSQSVAICPAGHRVIGGTLEWDTDGSVNGNLAIVKMFPNFTTNSWTAIGSNDEGTSETFHAVAFCLR